ncbi:MAG: UPF0262 family protein, partial [Pseudomonadota bacterium]
MTRLTHIDLDDRNLPPPTPEIEQERRVAIFDLLEENSFALPARDGRDVPDGPYRLGLSIREGRLVFQITTDGHDPAGEFHLSLGPFRQVVKDYFQICESYFQASAYLASCNDDDHHSDDGAGGEKSSSYS